jgi:hypothetical protein
MPIIEGQPHYIIGFPPPYLKKVSLPVSGFAHGAARLKRLAAYIFFVPGAGLARLRGERRGGEAYQDCEGSQRAHERQQPSLPRKCIRTPSFAGGSKVSDTLNDAAQMIAPSSLPAAISSPG